MLLADAGIVRHRGKIEAVINNAGRALEMIEREGSLAAFLWRYEAPRKAPSIAARRCPSSRRPFQGAQKLGWKFVGPTTVYAFMQSVGMVNDHDPGCHCHAASERARREFARPGQTG